MSCSTNPLTVVSFPSALGWLAALWSQDKLVWLTIAHASPSAAIRALPGGRQATGPTETTHESLAERLQAYCEGMRVDFADVPLDIDGLSTFQYRVARRCRQIPYGETITYGQLAARAGSPDAARAVGNAMARNRFPLIVPCHRVVGSGGSLGGFSAPSGVQLKRRLLEMEQGAAQPAN